MYKNRAQSFLMPLFFEQTGFLACAFTNAGIGVVAMIVCIWFLKSQNVTIIQTRDLDDMTPVDVVADITTEKKRAKSAPYIMNLKPETENITKKRTLFNTLHISGYALFFTSIAQTLIGNGFAIVIPVIFIQQFDTNKTIIGVIQTVSHMFGFILVFMHAKIVAKIPTWAYPKDMLSFFISQTVAVLCFMLFTNFYIAIICTITVNGCYLALFIIEMASRLFLIPNEKLVSNSLDAYSAPLYVIKTLVTIFSNTISVILVAQNYRFTLGFF